MPLIVVTSTVADTSEHRFGFHSYITARGFSDAIAAASALNAREASRLRLNPARIAASVSCSTISGE